MAGTIRDLLNRCSNTFEQAAEANGDSEGAPVETLSTLCPELSDALHSDPLAQLSSNPVDLLTPLEAADLLDLSGYYATHPPAPAIDAGQVHPILEQLPRNSEPASLWERFWNWVAEALRDEQQAAPDWIRELTLPEAVVDWVFYILMALMVAAAIAIVVNELWHALGQRRVSGRSLWRTDPPEAGRAPVLDDLGSYPVRERPGVLLKVLLATLERQGALTNFRRMTHRQIVRAAPQVPQAETLGDLASLAEAATYGGREPDVTQVNDLADRTRSVLQRMESPATGTRA